MNQGVGNAPETQQPAGSVVGHAAAPRRTADHGQRRGPLAILLVSLFVELIWLAAIGYVLYRVL